MSPVIRDSATTSRYPAITKPWLTSLVGVDPGGREVVDGEQQQHPDEGGQHRHQPGRPAPAQRDEEESGADRHVPGRRLVPQMPGRRVQAGVHVRAGRAAADLGQPEDELHRADRRPARRTAGPGDAVAGPAGGAAGRPGSPRSGRAPPVTRPVRVSRLTVAARSSHCRQPGAAGQVLVDQRPVGRVVLAVHLRGQHLAPPLTRHTRIVAATRAIWFPSVGHGVSAGRGAARWDVAAAARRCRPSAACARGRRAGLRCCRRC